MTDGSNNLSTSIAACESKENEKMNTEDDVARGLGGDDWCIFA